ncbi:peptidoglycan-binding domain-containing protein [Hydrogenophaga defluvii]
MSAVVVAVQQALRKQGLDVGSADGKLGRRTMAALMDYQRREGLAIGLVTFETLDKLGLPKPQP